MRLPPRSPWIHLAKQHPTAIKNHESFGVKPCLSKRAENLRVNSSPREGGVYGIVGNNSIPTLPPVTHGVPLLGRVSEPVAAPSEPSSYPTIPNDAVILMQNCMSINVTSRLENTWDEFLRVGQGQNQPSHPFITDTQRILHHI